MPGGATDSTVPPSGSVLEQISQLTGHTLDTSIPESVVLPHLRLVLLRTQLHSLSRPPTENISRLSAQEFVGAADGDALSNGAGVGDHVVVGEPVGATDGEALGASEGRSVGSGQGLLHVIGQRLATSMSVSVVFEHLLPVLIETQAQSLVFPATEKVFEVSTHELEPGDVVGADDCWAVGFSSAGSVQTSQVTGQSVSNKAPSISSVFGHRLLFLPDTQSQSRVFPFTMKLSEVSVQSEGMDAPSEVGDRDSVGLADGVKLGLSLGSTVGKSVGSGHGVEHVIGHSNDTRVPEPSVLSHRLPTRSPTQAQSLGVSATTNISVVSLHSIVGEFEGAEEILGPELGAVLGAKDGQLEGLEEGRVDGPREGAALGRPVGSLDGVTDGKSDGLVDGKALGLLLGLLEGCPEGASLGELLGWNVCVGDCVSVGSALGAGLAEGESEGDAEGTSLGLSDGLWDGTSLGATEGILDGAVLGEAEGASVGLSVQVPQASWHPTAAVLPSSLVSSHLRDGDTATHSQLSLSPLTQAGSS